VLKKIGFDVDAIQNPRQFQDSLLTMNPDVLVMNANGKKVKGLELSRTVKRVRGLPHVILIRSASLVREEDSGVEAWLDSPVGAMPLLNAIGDTCGLNKDVLADKFVKLQLKDVGDHEARVLKATETPLNQADMEREKVASGNFEDGGLKVSTMSGEERKERYKKFLQSDIPVQTGFSIKQVQDQVKELRQNENAKDLADLERQRKEFVEHLFKKK
jgi:hypothetical protein